MMHNFPKDANLKHNKAPPAIQNPLTLCKEHPPMGGGRVVVSTSSGQRYA